MPDGGYLLLDRKAEARGAARFGRALCQQVLNMLVSAAFSASVTLSYHTNLTRIHASA